MTIDGEGIVIVSNGAATGVLGMKECVQGARLILEGHGY